MTGTVDMILEENLALQTTGQPRGLKEHKQGKRNLQANTFTDLVLKTGFTPKWDCFWEGKDKL